MNENMVSDKFTTGLTKAASQIASLALAATFCAAATATEPFLRKNFGERYFTPFRFFVSAMAWLTLIGAPRFISPYPYARPHTIVILTGLAIFISYLAVSCIHLSAIRRRRRNGELWHSKSRGESVFGNEWLMRDLILEGVIMAALCCVSLVYGLFFLLSRVLGYCATAMEREAFYNRYLDIIDAKIDAEYMEAALRDGLSPRRTLGINSSLPAVLQGEHRANVARIVVTGQFGIGNQSSVAEKKPFAPHSANGPAKDSDSATSVSSQPADLKAASHTTEKTAKQTATARLFSKQFNRSAVIAVILIVCCAAGIVASRWYKGDDGTTPTVPSAKSHMPQTQNPNPVVSRPSPSPQSPQVLTSATAVENTTKPADSAVIVQTAFDTQRQQEAEKQKALESQRRQEQETQERYRNLAGAMKSKIADEANRLSSFQITCETTMTNGLRSFGFFQTGRRREFRKNSALIHDRMLALITSQQTTLGGWKTYIEANETHFPSDFEVKTKEFPATMKKMDEDREKMIIEIQQLNPTRNDGGLIRSN